MSGEKRRETSCTQVAIRSTLKTIECVLLLKMRSLKIECGLLLEKHHAHRFAVRGHTYGNRVCSLAIECVLLLEKHHAHRFAVGRYTYGHKKKILFFFLYIKKKCGMSYGKKKCGMSYGKEKCGMLYGKKKSGMLYSMLYVICSM